MSPIVVSARKTWLDNLKLRLSSIENLNYLQLLTNGKKVQGTHMKLLKIAICMFDRNTQLHFMWS